jgi:SMC interacting uncharacterized protein involved in chromosome segregation
MTIQRRSTLLPSLTQPISPLSQLEKLAMELVRVEEQTLALVARLGALRKEVGLSHIEVKEMETMQVEALGLCSIETEHLSAS